MGQFFKPLMVVTALGFVAVGCGTTTPAMPNRITEPTIDQPGRHIVRYRDTVIEVVLDTSFAANNLGDEWLILNAAMSGMTGGATKVKRDLTSLRTPDGRTIPMPTYREFNAAYNELASAARRAELAIKPDQLDRVDAESVIQLKEDVTSVKSALQTLRMIKVDIVREMTT